MNFFGLIFVAFGAYAVAGAAYDWEFFMNSRKSRFMVAVLGRNGARIFYGVLGIALIVLGILGVLGVVDMSKR